MKSSWNHMHEQLHIIVVNNEKISRIFKEDFHIRSHKIWVLGLERSSVVIFGYLILREIFINFLSKIFSGKEFTRISSRKLIIVEIFQWMKSHEIEFYTALTLIHPNFDCQDSSLTAFKRCGETFHTGLKSPSLLRFNWFFKGKLFLTQFIKVIPP